MCSKDPARGFVTAPILVALAVLISAVPPFPAKGAAPDGPRSLRQLIEEGRKESELVLMVTSSQGEMGAKELAEAFKRRFGLDIRMHADLSGQESQKFNKVLAETKAEISAGFDLMQGEPPSVINLVSSGGVEPIKNWEALLAEIALEAYKLRERVSPPGVAGAAFLWATRVTALLYNPRLISEQELSKTWREMGNPKFAGAFPVAPWLTIPLMCVLRYEKDECLEIIRSWGRNKRLILSYSAGTQRMMLGDVKFLFGNTENDFQEKARDPALRSACVCLKI